MKIKFKLPDGSIYELKDKKRKKALVFKLQAEGLDIKEDFKEIHAIFNSKVKKHWNNKTVPTKFEWDIPWKEYFQEQMKFYKDCDIKRPVTKFNRMSDLADVIMYQIIRAALMGLILSELTKNRKKILQKVSAVWVGGGVSGGGSIVVFVVIAFLIIALKTLN